MTSFMKVPLFHCQATLVEETDSSLIRILGEETVRGKKSNKSKQEEAEALANKGLKAWWAKMGKRFRSLSNSDFDSAVLPCKYFELCTLEQAITGFVLIYLDR